jgi:hypothetical protein
MSSWSTATKVAKEPSGSSSNSASSGSKLLKPTTASNQDAEGNGNGDMDGLNLDEGTSEESREERRRRAMARQAATARALLQTFDAHTRFTLDTLATLLQRDLNPSAPGNPSVSTPTTPSTPTALININTNTSSSKSREIVLTPKDIVAFDLGPLSALDARFVEWLIEEYGGGVGVSVKRGWRELFGLILGMGS